MLRFRKARDFDYYDVIDDEGFQLGTLYHSYGIKPQPYVFHADVMVLEAKDLDEISAKMKELNSGI